jgi:hypothetical protein
VWIRQQVTWDSIHPEKTKVMKAKNKRSKTSEKCYMELEEGQHFLKYMYAGSYISSDSDIVKAVSTTTSLAADYRTSGRLQSCRSTRTYDL